MRRPRLLVPALAALALAAPSCGGSLLDHAASPELLAPSSCAAGQVACLDACVPEDASHCGSACSDCLADALTDPNEAPVCSPSHACAFACQPGFLRSGTTCARVSAVSAGFAHTCALLANGEVKCWGANDHGQLGDGTGADSAVPVDVALPAPATALAAGYVHSCAVAGGAVYCWGDNTTGELGDGTTTSRLTPVEVEGLAGATAITGGGGEDAGTVATFYGHSCALTPLGLACWGSNDSGQLGDGTFIERTSPVMTAGLPAVPVAVAAGDRHTCAVAGGGVWCFGSNGAGQLGNGATTDAPVPQLAVGAGALAVGAGAAHSCAVVAGVGGTGVLCWGLNAEGQVNGGNPSPASVLTPVSPTLAAGVHPAAVVGGRAHTCVLVPGVANGVTCFGANDASQLTGAATPRGFVSVSLPAAQTLAAGYEHTCALLADGGLECWGIDDRGELGSGSAGTPQTSPVYVSGR